MTTVWVPNEHLSIPPSMPAVNSPQKSHNMNPTDVGSQAVSDFGSLQMWAQLVLYGTIIFLTLLGNVLVLVTIYRRSSLHNMSMYLVASLSVSDLMVGLTVMPLKVLFHIIG